MTDLTLIKDNIYDAKIYSFRFKGCGWAIFTICENTGIFSICSDWGNYAYRWNTEHLGEVDLHTFLAKCSSGYIIMKFAQDKPGEFYREFNIDATIDNLRDCVSDALKDERIDSNYASELRDDIDKFYDDFYDSSLNKAIDDIGLELNEFVNRDITEYLVYKPSVEYEFLKQQLLPFFLSYLRKNISN